MLTRPLNRSTLLWSRVSVRNQLFLQQTNYWSFPGTAVQTFTVRYDAEFGFSVNKLVCGWTWRDSRAYCHLEQRWKPGTACWLGPMQCEWRNSRHPSFKRPSLRYVGRWNGEFPYRLSLNEISVTLALTGYLWGQRPMDWPSVRITGLNNSPK
jgi:hypothetical protein